MPFAQARQTFKSPVPDCSSMAMAVSASSGLTCNRIPRTTGESIQAILESARKLSIPAESRQPFAMRASERLPNCRIVTSSGTSWLSTQRLYARRLDRGVSLRIIRSKKWNWHGIQVEQLPEGLFLATSEELPGLVAQGRTVTEVLEIARDVARREREDQLIFPTAANRHHYTVVAA